jgi:hypothetical protein
MQKIGQAQKARCASDSLMILLAQKIVSLNKRWIIGKRKTERDCASNRETLTIVDAQQTNKKMQQGHINRMNSEHNQFQEQNRTQNQTSSITDSVRGDKSALSDCNAAQRSLQVYSQATPQKVL